MKSLVGHIVLTLCLLLSCGVCAQEGRGALFSLAEGADGTWKVLFRMDGLTIDTSDGVYSRLAIEGMTVANGTAGCPALPSMSRMVLLPRGGRLTLRVDGTDETTWTEALPRHKPLQPTAGPTVKDAPWPDCHPDTKIYASDAWYSGGDMLQLEHVGTMGPNEVFRLTVRPVAYNPVGRSLRISTRIEATLVGQGIDAPGALQPASRRYLIVSRPQFREGLQPFVRWKRQQGYDVVERYADTNRRDAVKELIAPEFAAPDRQPAYLLLVGDAAQIQSFIGTTRPSGSNLHITDLYYAEHTGDYLPEAMLGRWPVNDTAELGAVVRKTVAYEQGLLSDTAALRRVLLVAGAEATSPAPTTTNGQVDYVGRETMLMHPELDTLTYRNPASADQRAEILADVGQGVALVNYTAHCTTGGWSSPSVSFGSVDTLGLRQPTLYVNNCCLSNDFGGTCFGEQLLRAPVAGAVGVIGATNTTLWNEDYYWAVGPKYPYCLEPQYDSLRPGAFDRWLGRSGGVHTQGALLAAGNLAVSAFGSPYDKFYWEIYCLLGDPSLEPWVGIPQPLDVHLADGSPRNGDGVIRLSGTPGATVTAMQHDSLLGCGTMGVDGQLALPLAASVDTSTLVVTATMTGRRPCIATVAVMPAADTAVALRDVSVGDSAVVCRVENVGTVPLRDLRVTLTQPGADSGATALVGQTLAVDTLMPQASRLLVIPLQLAVPGQTPDWQACLQAWDSTAGLLCSVTLQGRSEVHYPTLELRLLEAGGAVARDLQPRQAYTLEGRVSGRADSVVVTVSPLPSVSALADTVLSVPDSLFTIPFTTPDSLTHLRLQATLALGRHRTDYDYYLVGGGRTDGFEEGMASYPWQGGGTQPWQVDSTVAHSGRFSLRSGQIDYRQTSDLTLEVLLPVDDTLTYWSRISSEPNADKMIFTVDGVARGNARWGDGNWKEAAVALSAGRHTLRWRYIKDESGTQGSDCAWVDDIRLPMALWTAPYGCFGAPASVGVDPVDEGRLTFGAYPNPTAGRLYWQAEGVVALRLYDLYGRLLMTFVQPLPPVLDLAPLPDGVYLLEAVAGHDTYRQTILLRHRL